jgi:hypothetical protein
LNIWLKLQNTSASSGRPSSARLGGGGSERSAAEFLSWLRGQLAFDGVAADDRAQSLSA